MLRRGTPIALPLGSDKAEIEVLLQRGWTYRAKRIDKEGSRTIVEAEMVDTRGFKGV